MSLYKQIFLNTSNPGKLKEFQRIEMPIEVRILPEGAVEVIEDGKTFEDNAIKKAVAAARRYAQSLPDAIFLGEDSGLVVDELGGAPGVYSARFSACTLSEDNVLTLGEESHSLKGRDLDVANNRCLLDIIESRGLWQTFPEGVPARYQVALAAATSAGETVKVFEGRCPVRIVQEWHDERGFGYDWIVSHETLGHFGYIPGDVKDSVSHRGECIRKLSQWITESGAFVLV